MQSQIPAPYDSTHAPTQYVEVGGRKLAYRSTGSGTPIVFCTRFRGNLDCWDPAFLDALAERGFRVITFDYSGLGLSTGTPNYDPVALATDARDLIVALGLRRVVIGGWSLGGMAAQVFLALFQELVSHAVLIGTLPPFSSARLAEQLFFDTATKPVNDFDDEIVLFFEPLSVASREAAERSARRMAARTTDRSRPVPAEFAAAFLGAKPKDPAFPAAPVLAALKATDIPVLHIGGDHDISCPVENWYALNRQLPTVQLHTFPLTGHGPQHQHPETSADLIAIFVRSTARPVAQQQVS